MIVFKKHFFSMKKCEFFCEKKFDYHLCFNKNTRNGCLKNRDNILAKKTLACAYVALVQEQRQILAFYCTCKE